MSVDEAAALAFAALRAGRWEEVIGQVQALDLPELRSERPLLAARLMAWKAQALAGLNHLEEAKHAVLDAIRLAKSGGDMEGLAPLRELHAGISARLAALQVSTGQQAADADLLSMPEAEIARCSAGERVDILIRQASAWIERGEAAQGRSCAERALEEASSARAKVLAWLCLARLGEGEAAVRSAWKVADDADDHNLITAVAKAAKAAGVILSPPI